MDLEAYIKHLETFDAWTIIEPILDEVLPKFISANQQQLFEGKTVFGEDIRPLITEDPFFKTQKAAEDYAARKNRTKPNSKRGKDVANLYITGTFHRSIQSFILESGIDFKSTAGFASNIDDKFKDILGVDIESERFNKIIKSIEPKVIKAIDKFFKYGT